MVMVILQVSNSPLVIPVKSANQSKAKRPGVSEATLELFA
jgi:hypothetical protein